MAKKHFSMFVLPGMLAMAAIFYWGCRPLDRTISLSPNWVIAGIGDVTLRVSGGEFISGMSVRVGERILPAHRVSDRELTCTLPRESLLPREGGAETEDIAVCVLDAQGNEHSETASLTLARQYAWEAAAAPALDAASGGPRLFALAEKTLLLAGRTTAREILGAISRDAGTTWGAPAVLFAGEAVDGAVRFAAHPATGVAAIFVTAAGIVYRPLVGADGGAPALPAVTLTRTVAALVDLSVYCDRQGGLHLAWLDSHPAERFTFHYAFSADGGASWSAPRQVREVVNPQPGSYALEYHGLAIEGADSDGRVLLTARSSTNYRGSCERLLSRDHGHVWKVTGTSNRTQAGSAVSASGTLVLGGTVTVGSYPPITVVARMESSSDWETDWQERQFLGTDWIENKPSALVCLRADRWDNLLIAAYYNHSSEEAMAQAFFRSVDAGATWEAKAPWQGNLPLLKNMADLAIDRGGNAFALFRSDSGWLLYRASASSD